MLDFSPCRLSSLTDLGHDAYELRHCPQCAESMEMLGKSGELR